MPIVLRDPGIIKRRIDDCSSRLGDFKRHQLLKAAAAAYGYPTWELLVALSRPDAPVFAFDQDLARDAYETRIVEQSLAVSTSLGIHLVYAHELIMELAPTSDFARPRIKRPNPEYYFERALLGCGDLWWVNLYEGHHPLVPAGFQIAGALCLAEAARLRLSRLGGPKVTSRNLETFTFLMPPSMRPPYAKLTQAFYVTRASVFEIRPVPQAFMLKRGFKPALDGDDEYIWRVETKYETHEEATTGIADMGRHLRQLRAASKSLGYPLRPGQQAAVEVRDALGVPWYWPLEPIARHRPGWRTLHDEYEMIARGINRHALPTTRRSAS